MKKYFVVYFYKYRNHQFGIGNVFLELSDSIEKESSIRQVEKVIREKNHFSACAVVNFCKVDDTDG